MEILMVVLAVVLLSGTKKLIKSVADRNRAIGEALLIKARGEAAREKAKGQAEIIRANSRKAPNQDVTVRDGGKRDRS
ncbi:hypothetical protein ACFYYM_31810 [Streptomyces erythrochromogenes]|uniref:hypothetical protein n=1 Tax=Streptomyces erythrochromogenes TaxID=285574 RepID=UPI0036AEEFD6